MATDHESRKMRQRQRTRKTFSALKYRRGDAVPVRLGTCPFTIESGALELVVKLGNIVYPCVITGKIPVAFFANHKF